MTFNHLPSEAFLNILLSLCPVPKFYGHIVLASSGPCHHLHEILWTQPNVLCQEDALHALG